MFAQRYGRHVKKNETAQLGTHDHTTRRPPKPKTSASIPRPQTRTHTQEQDARLFTYALSCLVDWHVESIGEYVVPLAYYTKHTCKR